MHIIPEIVSLCDLKLTWSHSWPQACDIPAFASWALGPQSMPPPHISFECYEEHIIGQWKKKSVDLQCYLLLWYTSIRVTHQGRIQPSLEAQLAQWPMCETLQNHRAPQESFSFTSKSQMHWKLDLMQAQTIPHQTEWKKEIRKERDMTAPGKVEEKVYYRYMGEHRQGQRHPGESRVDMTRLSCAMWERGREKGNQVQETGDPKIQKESG